MRIGRASRASLLLMELMVSLLLFALAGAAGIRVIAHSRELSRQARELNRGVEQVSSAAELVRSAKSEREALALLTETWPQTVTGRETVIQMEEGRLRLTFRPEQRLTRCAIAWIVEEEEVYSLELLCFFREDSP